MLVEMSVAHMLKLYLSFVKVSIVLAAVDDDHIIILILIVLL